MQERENELESVSGEKKSLASNLENVREELQLVRQQRNEGIENLKTLQVDYDQLNDTLQQSAELFKTYKGHSLTFFRIGYARPKPLWPFSDLGKF